MLRIQLDIATQDVNRLLNAMSSNYNRPENVPNPNFDPGRPENPGNPREIPNPVSKEDFLHTILQQFLVENVRGFEVRDAKRQAGNSASANPPVDITIP